MKFDFLKRGGTKGVHTTSTLPINVDDDGFWTMAQGLLGFEMAQSTQVWMAYQRNPELHSIVDYIARSVSLGQWQHLLKEEVIEDSVLVDKLKNPHSTLSEKQFKFVIARELLLHGRVHILTNTPRIVTAGTSLFILPTHLTEMHAARKSAELATATDINEVIGFYRVKYADGTIDYTSEDVLTIATSDFSILDRRLVIKSPLLPLKYVLKVSPTLYESLYELNYNRGAVGIISNRSADAAGHVPFQAKEQEKIQRDWRKKYGSLKDRWQLLFSELWLDFQSISSPISEMMVPEQIKLVKEAVGDIYGFNTLLLNNNEGNKYANYQESRRAFFSEVVIPLADTIGSALSSYYLYARSDEQIILYYRHLEVFATDRKLQAEALSSNQASVISLNEAVGAGAITRDIAIATLVANGFTALVAESLIIR